MLRNKYFKYLKYLIFKYQKYTKCYGALTTGQYIYAAFNGTLSIYFKFLLHKSNYYISL